MLKIDNFWPKWQAYSLTLLVKVGCVGALFDLRRRLKKVESRRFLAKMASL